MEELPNTPASRSSLLEEDLLIREEQGAEGSTETPLQMRPSRPNPDSPSIRVNEFDSDHNASLPSEASEQEAVLTSEEGISEDEPEDFVEAILEKVLAAQAGSASEATPRDPPVGSSTQTVCSTPSIPGTMSSDSDVSHDASQANKSDEKSALDGEKNRPPYDDCHAKSPERSAVALVPGGTSFEPRTNALGPTQMPTAPGAYMIPVPLHPVLERIPTPGAFPIRGPSRRLSDSESSSSSFMEELSEVQDDSPLPLNDSSPIPGEVVDPHNVYEIVLRRRLSLEIEAHAIPTAIHTETPKPICSPRQLLYLTVALLGMTGIVFSIVYWKRESIDVTLAPTLSPVESPTTPAPVCGVSDIFEAVDLYLADPSPDAPVSLQFGYPIGKWCVTGITDFEALFSVDRNPAAATFNEDISGWDMSWATNLDYMFDGAAAFNQSLAAWDTSRVTSIARIFQDAISFDGDVSTWNTTNVEDMEGSFLGATSFNQDLSLWKTLNVRTMKGMFRLASSFNQPLNTWDVSNVRFMHVMFSGATSFDQALDTWDVSSVQYMSQMFEGASAFNGDVTTWDVSSVVEMQATFRHAISFNKDISRWPVQPASFIRMFENATAFNQDLCAWREVLRGKPPFERSRGDSPAVLMFSNTSCPAPFDPVWVDSRLEGPFCHSCD